MRLRAVETVNTISGEDFQKNFFRPQIPLVIRDLSKTWPAYTNWNWNYFKELVGHQKVGIYNNVKSDPYTPVNKADEYVQFGDYIDMISNGPAQWRIFLFNIFSHAPSLTQDFSWPDHLMKGFVKRAPMLFMGGQGSVTHMHFDMDLSHIFHTQFAGKKRILLFPYNEQVKLYRKPFEVMSLVDFSHYYDDRNSKVDYSKYGALRNAMGYDLTLGHGETLFMPGGYWHHMEYVESGFAMSLRAIQSSFAGKAKGVWNLFGMRTIDTVMKKTFPELWQDWKEKQCHARAKKFLPVEKFNRDVTGFSPVMNLKWDREG
jgi:hypothetical protein